MSQRLAEGRARIRPVYFAALVAYMGLIFFLSAQPSQGEGPMSYWLQLLHQLPFGDKGAHFLEYSGLGLLARGAFGSWPAALMLGAIYGITDEIHQSFVPGRDANGADWLADVLGTAAGALIFGWMMPARRDSKTAEGPIPQRAGEPAPSGGARDDAGAKPDR